MTMLLPSFVLHRPTSLTEAAALVRELGGEDCDFLLGGTDLLPNYKCGLNAKPHVIALGGIDELRRVDIDGLDVGAGVSLQHICDHPRLGADLPVLAEAAGQVASVLIRRQATVGGNLMLDTRCHFFNQSYLWRRGLGYCLKAEGDLCHVVPRIKNERGEMVDNTSICYATHSSDLAPVMIALDATLVFFGPEGRREQRASGFYRPDGIARFHKRPGEFLILVRIPRENIGARAGYAKLAPRESWDFPVLGVAANLKLDGAGRVTRLRLAVNAVDTHPLDFSDLGTSLIGEQLDDPAIDRLAAQVLERIEPKLNVPMSPAYRKKMGGVFTRRLLKRLRASSAG